MGKTYEALKRAEAERARKLGVTRTRRPISTLATGTTPPWIRGDAPDAGRAQLVPFRTAQRGRATGMATVTGTATTATVTTATVRNGNGNGNGNPFSLRDPADDGRGVPAAAEEHPRHARRTHAPADALWSPRGTARATPRRRRCSARRWRRAAAASSSTPTSAPRALRGSSAATTRRASARRSPIATPAGPIHYHPTEIPNLYFMPTGRGPARVPYMFEGRAFDELAGLPAQRLRRAS